MDARANDELFVGLLRREQARSGDRGSGGCDGGNEMATGDFWRRFHRRMANSVSKVEQLNGHECRRGSWDRHLQKLAAGPAFF
jgi:hypothetical protein